jgi:molybdopterin converting factor small subunit
MVKDGNTSKVKIEFFGPFRKFGKCLELPSERELTFDELISRLAEELGESFRERALMKNTTCILNNKVIERKGLGEVRIAPGDRVAFALIMGGG